MELDPARDLASTIARYRQHNDSVEANHKRERGSRPSAPPPAAVVMTPERAKEVAKLIANSHPLLVLVQLLGVSLGELEAYGAAAVKGAGK